MHTQDSPAVWVLLGVVVVALLVGSVVRRVPAGGLVLITWRGVTIRTYSRGLAVRLPGLERSVVLDTGPEPLLTVVRAETADGDDVRVLATANAQLVALPTGRPYADPWAFARTAVDAALAEAVAQHHTCDLSLALPDAMHGVRAAADAASRPAGVAVTEVVVDEIEVLLALGARDHGPD